MKSLILLLVLASAAAGSVDIQKRVYGGGPCGDKQGQHYVILTDEDPTPNINRNVGDFKERFCGGNLISEDWVLTAGHCDKGEFWVILARHPTGKGTIIHIAPNTERHVYSDKGHGHDIMLVKLPDSAEGYTTIRLPDVNNCKSPTADGTSYTIMGWSYTDADTEGVKNQNLPDKLQCGTVQLHKNCTGRGQTVYNNDTNGHQWIEEHLLCSYTTENNCNTCQKETCEICKGDSGGSLVGKDGVLVGVNVASPLKVSGLSYFMDVCAYRDWIKKTAKI